MYVREGGLKLCQCTTDATKVSTHRRNEMLIPLKKKYLVAKPVGCGQKKAGGNSTPKKKTIWKHLSESAKKRGK